MIDGVLRSVPALKPQAAAPKVSGARRVGQILRVTPGVWNESEGVTYKYVWKRGTRVVSTRPTYRLVAADRGKTLKVTVTATDSTGTYRAGTAGVNVAVPRR